MDVEGGNPVRHERTFTNHDVAAHLRLIANLKEIKGEGRFHYLAFRNAADVVENLGEDINDIAAEGKLTDLPSVGKGVAEVIGQFLASGDSDLAAKLRSQVPVSLVALLDVEGLGPKKVARLWQELGITTLDALKDAAEAGKIRQLKGFGTKSEEKILKGIALLAQRQSERTPLGQARPAVLSLIADLKAALPDDAITAIEPAGSVRRWKESVGDLDILTITPQPEKVMTTFYSLPQVQDVLWRGETKSRVRLNNSLECDLRAVAPRHWGTALQYFTGSKQHNIELRELALKQGWSLSEYDLEATGQGEAPAGEKRTFETEEALYEFLGLDWIPPEMREARGEIALARAHHLPRLITIADIQGELHGHSNWSDGKASIQEMAEAAIARGYRYWLLSDHSIGLGVTGGVDGEKLAQQRRIVTDLNRSWADAGVNFRLLLGVELEILADGSLALPDDVLAQLDVVVASIHSSLRQDRETITRRALNAVNNPHVDILGHPTSRLLGKRPPSEIDMERVLRACAETGTGVEINAHPARLDLNDVYARRAVDLGCKIAISTDAHRPQHMDFIEYGVAVARRAWLTSANVINTQSWDKALGALK
jgi:DNA polymerase (family 10)